MKEVKCIKCGFVIKMLHAEFGESDVESAMWDGGIVGTISANYGSVLDGNIYVIGICDNCVKANPESITYVGNYME